MTPGSGFKQQCDGVATTKPKGWEGHKSRELLCVKCIQGMHHCLLSALANAPALFNLISLSSHRFIFAGGRTVTHSNLRMGLHKRIV